MTHSIGRIVHYTVTEGDATATNKRRADMQRHLQEHRDASNGSQVHVGNTVRAGDVFPMMITRVWGEDLVNGQVFLDGNDTLWVTSVHEFDARDLDEHTADRNGTFRYPVIVR